MRTLGLFRCAAIMVLAVAGLSTLGGPGGHAYEGRDLGAEWRRQAEIGIRRHRKAKLLVEVVDEGGRAVPGAFVRVSMTRHAFGFGSAVSAKRLMARGEDFDRYREVVLSRYNKVVLENDLKWDQWEASKTNPPGHGYYFPQTFAALRWLKDRNIGVRGHYVSWGPVERLATYKALKGDLPGFRNLLFAHIYEKVRRVGNFVDEWDSINHPIGWNSNLVTLEKLFGRQIYVDILKRTNEFNPAARLYVNEGNILPAGKYSELMRDQYEGLIRDLLKEGAPLHGIGFMGHFTQNRLTAPVELWGILDRFAVFQLPLQVTEFDLRFADPKLDYSFTDDELRLQADYTRDFMTAMFAHPAVEGIVMWGFWEGFHYHPSAALYRRDWTQKPNGLVWDQLVLRDWWTEEQGQTDASGVFSRSGFLGDYEVVVQHGGKKNVERVKLPRGGTRVTVSI